MYFPRNWEFGSALSKLRNFGGWGRFEPPKPPLGTPLLGAIAPWKNNVLKVKHLAIKKVFQHMKQKLIATCYQSLIKQLNEHLRHQDNLCRVLDTCCRNADSQFAFQFRTVAILTHLVCIP
jgi:hypothetical protein